MTLKDAISARGLTQRKLAALSGISLKQIADFCTGRSSIGNMAARNYILLCDVLELDPHALLGESIYAVYAHRPGWDPDPDNLSAALLTFDDPNSAEEAARSLFDDPAVDEAMVVTFTGGTAQPRPLRIHRSGPDLVSVRLPKA